MSSLAQTVVLLLATSAIPSTVVALPGVLLLVARARRSTRFVGQLRRLTAVVGVGALFVELANDVGNMVTIDGPFPGGRTPLLIYATVHALGPILVAAFFIGAELIVGLALLLREGRRKTTPVQTG